LVKGCSEGFNKELWGWLASQPQFLEYLFCFFFIFLIIFDASRSLHFHGLGICITTPAGEGDATITL